MSNEYSFITKVLAWVEKYKVAASTIAGVLAVSVTAILNYLYPFYSQLIEQAALTAMLGVICIGAVLLLLARSHHQHKESLKASELVYKPGSRYNEDIRDLMLNFVSQHGIRFGTLAFNNVLTINDLVKVASRSAKPRSKSENVKETILAARRAACTHKYARHWDRDEKVKLNLTYGAWTDQLKSLLSDAGVASLEDLDVIDVGFGNGSAYEVCQLFRTPKSFRAIDVSEKALELAQLKFPNAQTITNDAEDLVDIPSEDVDVYFSFRTYQSSLFDQRAALHEALRVLRPRGILTISVPCRYVIDNKEVYGLGDWKKRITKKYLMEVVSRIESYAEMLGFTEIRTVESPYEYFIFGRKPSKENHLTIEDKVDLSK